MRALCQEVLEDHNHLYFGEYHCVMLILCYNE